MKEALSIERYLGSVKFAVILILTFTVFMIFGTFQESYHGADYASRLIYKRAPFMFLQFLFFICVTTAALLRFPFKKRLAGFYTVHLGIVTIISGSFITFYAGIDGSIQLNKNSPNRYLTIGDDVVEIKYLESGKKITYHLPYKASETSLGDQIENIKFEKYFPFADLKTEWVEIDSSERAYQFQSDHYFLKNRFIEQELIFSNYPNVARDFESFRQLGPLQVNYLDKNLSFCFEQINPSCLIIWNQFEKKCYTIESLGISIQQTKSKKSFIVFKDNNKNHVFFPDLSPFPIMGLPDKADQIEFDRDSPFKIFNKNIFTSSPGLFLFGESVSYFDQEKNQWILKSFPKTNGPKEIALPWMDSKIMLVKHYDSHYPLNLPKAVTPIQDGGQLVSGQEKGVSFFVGEKKFWLTQFKPITLYIEDESVQFILKKKQLKLPFEFNLTKFKMDTDPGTNRPASYESFVNLFTENGMKKHHIYMNNPLKYGGFTFYQASYFQDQQGDYGSVLSVNYDPGRFLKYLGSVFLVFGAFGHFFINRKKNFLRPK